MVLNSQEPRPVPTSSLPPTCLNLYPSPEGVHVRIGDSWKLLRWESLKSFLLKPENTAHLPEEDVVRQTALFLMRREESQVAPQPLIQSAIQPQPTSTAQVHLQTQAITPSRSSTDAKISGTKSDTVNPPESEEPKNLSYSGLSYSGGKAKVRKGKIIVTSVHASSDEGRNEPYPTKKEPNHKVSTDVSGTRGKKMSRPKPLKTGGK